MSEKAHNKNHDTDSFVQRWSQRKHQQQSSTATQPLQPENPPEQPDNEPVKEEDLPPIESLHENSEVSMFLSEGISEKLRRQALRRLFHFGKFNVCDGLDDYAEDYTFFQPLSDLINVGQQLDRITKISDKTENQPQKAQHAPTLESQDNEQDQEPAEIKNNDDIEND